MTAKQYFLNLPAMRRRRKESNFGAVWLGGVPSCQEIPRKMCGTKNTADHGTCREIQQ
jgi:hypothetical protein